MRHLSIFFTGVLTSLAMMPLVAPSNIGASTAFSARQPASMGRAGNPASGAVRDDDGLFYVDGKLENRSIRFLVDTGASHVVLSHRDAKKVAPYVPSNTTGVVVTAGGPVAVDWIVIEEISFDGHSIKNLKAAVPRRDTGVSLLGQNALAQFDSLSIEGDTLTLSR